MGLILNSVIFTIFAFFGFILYNAGFFSKINVSRNKIPKMTIAGIRFKGTYLTFYVEKYYWLLI